MKAILRRGSTPQRFARRVNAVLLLDMGWSCAEVAEAFLLDDTIRDFYKAYVADGLAGLCAVEMAVNDGAPTKTHVLNLLHRLADGKSAEVGKVEAPQALALAKEPRADVERYDALRKAEQEERHAS